MIIVAIVIIAIAAVLAYMLIGIGLEQVIQRGVENFDLARLEVRVSSADALARGEGFQVIEVNGASSEPAHVYHPGSSVWTGLRAFLGIWRDMMDIGAANSRQGVPWVRPFALGAMAWREHSRMRGGQWPSNVWDGDRQRAGAIDPMR